MTDEPCVAERAASRSPLRVLEAAIYRGAQSLRSPARGSASGSIWANSKTGRPTRSRGFADTLLAHLPGPGAPCLQLPAGGRLSISSGAGHLAWPRHRACRPGASDRRGIAGFARQDAVGPPGVPASYDIVYRYRDEALALAAGGAALRLVHGFAAGDAGRVGRRAPSARQARRRAAGHGCGCRGPASRYWRAMPSAPPPRALVEAAERRGIPVTRLDRQSFIQLGHGSRQQRLRASITGQTSQVAVSFAGNKDMTKAMLAELGPAGARTARSCARWTKRLPPRASSGPPS